MFHCVCNLISYTIASSKARRGYYYGYVGDKYRNISSGYFWAFSACRNRMCAHNIHTKVNVSFAQLIIAQIPRTPADPSSSGCQVNEVIERCRSKLK